MSPESDPKPPSSEPGAAGLKHNPFAALRTQAGLPPVPAPNPATAPEPPASAPPPSQRAAPAAGRVVVRRERKGHGGKSVTIAEGPGLAGCDVSGLAREAARALGAGAREVDGALVVQGESTERLVAWLVARGFGPVSRGN